MHCAIIFTAAQDKASWAVVRARVCAGLTVLEIPPPYGGD